MNSFSAPKNLGKTPFYNFKRLPRKTKKQLNKAVPKDKYYFLDDKQRMWYYLGMTNQKYRDFLIQEICKRQNAQIARVGLNLPQP